MNDMAQRFSFPRRYPDSSMVFGVWDGYRSGDLINEHMEFGLSECDAVDFVQLGDCCMYYKMIGDR